MEKLILTVGVIVGPNRLRRIPIENGTRRTQRRRTRIRLIEASRAERGRGKSPGFSIGEIIIIKGAMPPPLLCALDSFFYTANLILVLEHLFDFIALSEMLLHKALLSIGWIGLVASLPVGGEKNLLDRVSGSAVLLVPS